MTHVCPGIYDSWGGAPLSDLHAVVAYLEEHSDDVLPELDFDRAALAGASYGGYMISWMFGEAPRGSRLSTTARIQSTGSLRPLAQRFRCAIWHDGIFSLPTFFLESDHCMGGPDFHGAPYPWRHVQNGKSSDSESPSGVSRILSSASLLHRWNPAAPLRLASWSRNAPPTLVIHSERDYRCPITEGLGVFKTLQAMGIDSRFVTFPDECHFVLGKHNALAWYEEMEAWLERWLR